MKPGFLSYLCCPHDQAPFDLRDAAADGREIMGGRLVCTRDARHAYPIVRGIPRIIDGLRPEDLDDHYAASFGFQWTHLPWENGDADPREFWNTTGFDAEFLAGKTLLDGGCGGGRTTGHLPAYVKEIVYLDYSTAVERVYQRCGHLHNAHFVQASLEAPPLRRERFDVVFSHGVIHHTRNTYDTFCNLPPLVRPGGYLHLYVFRRAAWPTRIFHLTDHALRGYVRRMPRERLLRFCRRIGWFGGRPSLAWLKRFFWFSQKADPDVRLAHNHDHYACTYHHEHTVNEVIGWFAEHGFHRIGYTNGWPDAPLLEQHQTPGWRISQRLGLSLTVHGFKKPAARPAGGVRVVDPVGQPERLQASSRGQEQRRPRTASCPT